MSVDPQTVKEALRRGGDEYQYRDDTSTIVCTRINSGRAEVSHFVVRRDSHGQHVGGRDASAQQIATTLLDSLEEVLQEDGLSTIEIDIAATECSSLDELEQERAERENPDWHDPSYGFLRENGFRNLDYVEKYQQGLCVNGRKPL